MVGRDPTEILRPKSLAAAKFSGRRLLLDGRPESTSSGHCGSRQALQLGKAVIRGVGLNGEGAPI